MQSEKRWVIFQKDQVLLCDTQVVIDEETLRQSFEGKIVRSIKLGTLNSIEYFCAELESNFALQNSWELITLRQALTQFYQDHFYMLTRASFLISWDKNHQFCGRCTQETTSAEHAYERYCASCHLNYYPRISPSIIVLIKRDEDFLMARGHHFPPGVYGLIAGFVEPGETLEDAVHREVFEEVGILIKNLSYFGSQPWPFPDSLMIGFVAEYASGEIRIDQKEIEDAGWYRYDQLPGFPSMSISIACDMMQVCIEDIKTTA